jgi:small conductance mechanosensitive channel
MENLLTRQLQELVIQATSFIPNLIAAIVIFLFTLWASRFLAQLLRRQAEQRHVDQELCILLERLTYWAALILGTIVSLDKVSFNVTGFVAGLGIVGFTLGFALQDIAKNFVAGILLLLQQPFGVGNAIEVQGFSGTVLDIAIRATTIKTWDGQEVTIPNADIYTNPITNYSRFPLRRVGLSIGIGYGMDIQHTLDVFLATLRGLEGVEAEPAPTVVCDGLGSSTVDLMAYFWFDQRTTGLLAVKNRAVKALKEVAEREGIDMPYPIQTVQVLSKSVD